MKVSRYIPFLLVILCLVLQLVHVTTFSVQHDEPFSIFTSNLVWEEFWQVFINENNPPLHPILLKLVIETFGFDLFAMRFLSVSFSSLTVYFIYKSGEQLYDNRAGIVASMFFIFSNLQLTYAHQIRAYSLLVFLASISLYLFIKLIISKDKRTFIWLGLVNGLMLYTHFMGLVYVCFLGISLIIFFKEKLILKQLIFSFILTFILFTPYLPIFLTRMSSAQSGGWLGAPSELMSIYFTYWKFFNVPISTVIGILLIISCLWIKNPTIKKEILLFFTIIIFSFIGLFFISQYLPLYLERYLLFIAPILYLTISITILEWCKLIRNNYLQITTLAILPIIFIASFKIKSDINLNQDARWEEINKHKENKIIVFSPSWLDLNYCYYTDKNTFFQKTNSNFTKAKQENNIYKDYEFIIKQNFKKNQTVLISSTENSEELKKVLSTKFILVRKISENLCEYKLK